MVQHVLTRVLGMDRMQASQGRFPFVDGFPIKDIKAKRVFDFLLPDYYRVQDR